MSSRRKIVITVVVLLAIMAGAAVFGIWRFLGGAPEEVSLQEAVSAAQAAQSDDAAPEPAGEAGDDEAPTDETASATEPADDGHHDASATASATAPSEGGHGEDAPHEHGHSDESAAPAQPVVAAPGCDDLEAGASSSGSGADSGSLAGCWEVDAETGTFDFESASGSFAGFRVDEVLRVIGEFTAVGRTGDISGLMEIDGGPDEFTVTSTEITVNVASLRSNKSHRDHHVREALKASSFPTAQFVLTEPLDLGSTVAEGNPFSVAAPGELTLAGETRPAVFDLQAQFVGEVIAVVGSTGITFADFSIDVPDDAAVISVEDHGIIEFQLLFRRAG